MVNHGRSTRENKARAAKLTETQVRHIRALEGTTTHLNIAKMFNVAAATIDDILAKRTWSWLS